MAGKRTPTSAAAEKFGDLIREAREHKGLSLREVGESIGVHYANLSKMETNQRRPPARDKVIALARVLGLDVNRLLVAAGYPVDLRYFHAHLAAEDKIAALDVAQIGPALSQGLEQARDGEYERALTIFQRLQQIADLWEIYAALGTTLYRMRKYREAELNLKMAIARIPSRPLPPWSPGPPPEAPSPWPQARVYYDLSLVYTDTGRLNLAESCILRAIETGTPFQDLYYSQLCKIYTYQERYDRVIQVAEQVREERRKATGKALAVQIGGAQGRAGSLHNGGPTDRSPSEPAYSLGYFDVCALASYAYARRGQFEAAQKLLDGLLSLYNRYWYIHYVSAVVHAIGAEALFRDWNRQRRAGRHSKGQVTPIGAATHPYALLRRLIDLLHRARTDFQLGMMLYPDFRELAARDPDLRILRKRAFNRVTRWSGYKEKGRPER